MEGVETPFAVAVGRLPSMVKKAPALEQLV
jgi:hypothetical protein